MFAPKIRAGFSSPHLSTPLKIWLTNFLSVLRAEDHDDEVVFFRLTTSRFCLYHSSVECASVLSDSMVCSIMFWQLCHHMCLGHSNLYLCFWLGKAKDGGKIDLEWKKITKQQVGLQNRTDFVSFSQMQTDTYTHLGEPLETVT